MGQLTWVPATNVATTTVENTKELRWAYPNGSACLQQKVVETHYVDGKPMNQTYRWVFVPHVHAMPEGGWDR